MRSISLRESRPKGDNFHSKLSSCTKIPEHGFWEASKCDESLGFVCQIPRPQSNCLQTELDKQFADQGMTSTVIHNSYKITT